VNGGYEQPMKGDLLWVYEGLTNYYGELLAARGGLISAQEWLDELASDAFSVSEPGRTWRPLQDTADSAPFLYVAGGFWGGWRRTTDFYAEGSLLWLEADVTIRKLTNGAKSLDDFCTLFHGQRDSGRVWMKPYDVAEVYDTLNTVAPFEWRRFFEQRLAGTSAAPPLGGFEQGGYTLVYTEAPNPFTDPWTLDGSLNALGSLGIHVTSDGLVDNAWNGSPAFRGGISNGMKLVAVNGRRFSIDELKRAIAGSKASAGPIECIVENGSYFSVVRVDYHGGTRYPHLERASGDDVLASIAAARVK
jgi:predicted metalloprotease with PDZ domain